MRKSAKETTQKESVKKEKKARVRPEVVAEPADPPVTVEPAEAPATEPEIERTAVVATGIPTIEAPAEVPAPVESAQSPVPYLAPEEAAPSPIEVATCTEVATDAQVTAEQKEAPRMDLDVLRKPVEEAKVALDAAEADAKVLRENARLIDRRGLRGGGSGGDPVPGRERHLVRRAAGGVRPLSPGTSCHRHRRRWTRDPPGLGLAGRALRPCVGRGVRRSPPWG